MNLQGRNLSGRMRGDDVKLLQRELGQLDYAISDPEIARGYFGQTTRQAVLEFQEKQGLDTTGLVDGVTASRINVAVVALESEEEKMSVSGKTLKQTGEKVSHQKLYAYDVDLRGASIYRTVQNFEKLEEQGGFEFLAELNSDRKGNYNFTFTRAQYQEAERKKADVIVFAVIDEEIIGRSRLVKSTEYTDRGEIRNLDVIITRQVADQTEYELLMAKLNQFLEESEVTLLELVSSGDQTTFTAEELDEEPVKIHVAAKAESLRNDHDEELSHELIYGIGRQNIQLSWPSLYRKSNAELKAAIDKSIREKIIQKYSSRRINAFLNQVQQSAIEATLEHKGVNQITTVDEMLSFALPKKQRKVFMLSLRNFDGDYETFWKEHLPKDPAFRNKPKLITRILFTNQLILISSNHPPLVEELQVKRKLTSAHQLLELSTAEWKKILKKTGVPEHIYGKDEAGKIKRYTEQLQNTLHAAYPTQKLALMVKTKELPIKNGNVAKGVYTFLARNDKFDIASSRIHDFEEEIKTASPDHHEEVKNELFAIQRVFQVSPTPQVMSKLIENGLTSAYAIAGIPEKSFMKMYGDTLGGTEYAYAVHQKATFINTRIEHIAVGINEILHSPKPQYI